MGALGVLVIVLGIGFLASRRGSGKRGRLSPGWRRTFLVAHITSSVAWFTVVICLVALGAVGLMTTDPRMAQSAYGAMLIFDDVFLGYVSPLALATGIVLGVSGRWGVLRHWWVAAKLAITITLILTGVFVMHVSIQRAGEHAAVVSQSLPPDALHTRYVLFIGCVLSASLLFGAVLLAVFKPWGETPLRKKTSQVAQPALDLVVVEMEDVAAGVRTLRLSHPDGATLPPWQPGAHVELFLPSGRTRQYSLIGDPADRTSYQIAVKRQRLGRGGSKEVHRMVEDQPLGGNGPRNHFPLVVADSYLFLAGGIGITPLLPMIERIARTGAPWQLVYAGRSRESMPFASHLDDQYPTHVRVFDHRPNLVEILEGAQPGTAVYVCGPDSMTDAVERLMPEYCSTGSLHTERFGAGAPSQAFEVEIDSTGHVLEVAKEDRLLDVLRSATPKIDASCEDGYCGTCAVPVIDGTPDHRDTVPGPHDNVIYPCVSRAMGRLIVDL